jgi:hypothetical protein
LTWTLSAGLAAETAPTNAAAVNDMRHSMPFDDVEQARHIEHVAQLDVDLLENVANEPFVAVAGKDDGTVSFADEPAACLRADHTHPAGD